MFGKFLKFDELVTPSIIKFVYYILLVLAVLSGIGMMVSGMSMASQGGPMAAMGAFVILGGPVLTIFEIVLIRISTELVLVFFMMRDELAWNREFQQGLHANKKTRAPKAPSS